MDATRATSRISGPPSGLRGRSFGSLPVLLGFAVLALTGCNDDNDIVDPDPGFSMGIDPDEVTVEPGGTATVDVEVSRTGGFDGSVNVTVEDLPEGVTAEDETIGSAATSATVTLQADAEAEPTTATSQVRGTGTGVDDEVETLEVTVEEPEPEEGFAMSLEPDSVTIEQDDEGEVTVNIERFGDWEGSVALSMDEEAEGFPDEDDVEFTFDPETVEPEEETSTLTVAVDEDAETGEYTVYVQGSAEENEDVPDQEVELYLEITEANGGS